MLRICSTIAVCYSFKGCLFDRKKRKYRPVAWLIQAKLAKLAWTDQRC